MSYASPKSDPFPCGCVVFAISLAGLLLSMAALVGLAWKFWG